MEEYVDLNKSYAMELTDIASKRHYPAFHLAPPAGWINDPNGLIFYKGKYHAFYQYYPHSGYRGPMHWGHATSDDLVTWKNHPLALAPGKDGEGDRDGVFSGSAVDNNGVMTILYTGHVLVSETEDDCTIRQVQMLATSEDGFTFKKHGTVIEAADHIQHFRDPKVWKEGNQWKMILGVSEHNQGQVWLYTSDDLKKWKFDQVLLKAKEGQGWMWECPDFFQIGDKWVLVVSPMGIERSGFSYNNHMQVGYFVGHFENNKFVVDQDFTELDNGHDFYAPQTYSGTKDRIMFGWFAMPESPLPEQEDHWATHFTVPRVISLHGTQLLQNPLPDLKKLRQEHVSLSGATMKNQIMRTSLATTACEIAVEFDLTTSNAERYGLIVGHNKKSGEGLRIYVNNQDNRLYLDRSHMKTGATGLRSIPLPKDKKLSLKIFVDKSSCEVFVNNGEKVLSCRFYPEKHGSLSLFAENGIMKVTSLEHWNLRNIWRPYVTNM